MESRLQKQARNKKKKKTPKVAGLFYEKRRLVTILDMVTSFSRKDELLNSIYIQKFPMSIQDSTKAPLLNDNNVFLKMDSDRSS